MRIGTFRLDGTEYEYFHHPANTTWANERAVELPIVLERVLGRQGTMLEVGNVLSQYVGRNKWTTVDLKEKEDGVVNVDILDYYGGSYDLIVSVSTFEHIGVDECSDRFLAVDAVKHCANHLLAPGGRLLLTAPVGYNPVLDAWLAHRWPGRTLYMVKVSKENVWVQADREVALRAEYGSPYPCANAICVGTFARS